MEKILDPQDRASTEKTKRPRAPRIDAVSSVLKAALVGQRIVRLLEPLNVHDQKVAIRVVEEHFCQTMFAFGPQQGPVK
jgi:hypothetical protein